jgi:hypothetical protein
MPESIERSQHYEILYTRDKSPVPVAARANVWVCGRSLVGIAGLNPAGVMDVCLL